MRPTHSVRPQRASIYSCMCPTAQEAPLQDKYQMSRDSQTLDNLADVASWLVASVPTVMLGVRTA